MGTIVSLLTTAVSLIILYFVIKTAVKNGINESSIGNRNDGNRR